MSTELDPQARALIGLALQGERRLPRHRERVRRGVLTALAAPAALGTTEAALAAGKTAVVGTAAATGSKAALLGIPLLKAVPLVVLGVTAGVVGLKQLHAPPPKPGAAIALATPGRAAPATAVSAAAPVPAPEQVSHEAVEASEPPAPLKVTRAAPPGNAESPATPPPPSLAVELEALQRAQRALNAGNAASALQELRAVKGPALRAERTALEVFAHCALGNAAAARKQAALFRKLAPGSPLLPRVEASCARPSAHD